MDKVLNPSLVSQPHARQKDWLSSDEARLLLQRHGPNRLPEARQAGFVEIFLRQFLSPFIYILAIAAVVSLLVRQIPSGVFIIAVLLINAIIGTVQEYSAQQSASALRRMVKGSARVVRDGVIRLIDAEELVPGDRLLLNSGDRVPADLLLLESHNLAIDESLLTGESLAVAKDATVQVAEDGAMADQLNRGFAGSIVTQGRAVGRVTATGIGTRIGAIAEHVTRRRASEPPLMIRVRRFTYRVAFAIVGSIIALLALMQVMGGYAPNEMVMMTIGLAVSAIPEGLPAALTVALAIGMRRMVGHNVIIRRLVAVEALGSCTFICSDKTGTLTVNELTIRKVVLPDGESFEVTGEGVHSGGGILGEHPEDLVALCETGILANESHLDYGGEPWTSDGDIVDVAFLVLAKKLGLSVEGLRARHQRIELLPYESERAFSGTLNRLDEQRRGLFVKGSPEKMLELSSHMKTREGMVPLDRVALERQFVELAGQGYRLIGLARRELVPGQALEASLEQLVFLGLVAMIDPLRPEACDAIRRCRAGGIQVAMITGDHPATANAIATDLNLCRRDDPVITGAMIRAAEQQGTEVLDRMILSGRVFARIEPMQKETIVDSFMRAGHFVAVTGDGVNDAPALRRANAGVAMGQKGTDVAREVADLIITDDNFASIVDGVEQGRIVYNNIRKVIALLIATGFSALLLFFLTVLVGLPMPMIAVQLLWLNLIANGLQDVALAFEPGEGDELTRPPRRPDEPIFERRIVEHVLVIGSVMGLLAFACYATLIGSGETVEQARNLTLMLMVLFGNIHALSSRSEERSLFEIPLFANPFLILAVPLAQAVHIGAMYLPGISEVLQIRPISFGEWSALLGIALLLLLAEELHKWHLRRASVRESRVPRPRRRGDSAGT